jgi:hypothetical protein
LIVRIDPTMRHAVAMQELTQSKRRGVRTVAEDM